MLGRRSLLGVLLAYAGLTVVVVALSRVHARCTVSPRVDAVDRAAPAELVAGLGLAVGAAVGRWTVSEVGPLRGGNLRVELRAAGERVALTLARPDPTRPRPLAGTEQLAIYPAVHDLAAYTPTAATQAAATALATALAGRAAPAELLPLR